MSFASFETIDAFRLDGKVSVVTGATRGIGQAIAEALAGAGSDLVLVGRVAPKLEEVAETIRQRTSRRVEVVVGDVTDRVCREAMVGAAREGLGRLDVLVNNAGINRRSDSGTFGEDEWDLVVGVDLKAAFFVAQACGNAMIELGAGGKIINILSLASAIGLPGIPAYSAAKGGLLTLTKTLAVEWAPHGVRVNGIGPGYIRTELNRALREDHRNDWILRRTPMRRWGEPAELCGAAVFLASRASDFVTGEVVYVDGGFLAGSDWRTGD